MVNMLSLNDLATEMTKGIVKFSYLKKDGTYRFAYGTRNEQFLSDNNVAMSGKPSPSSVFTYWDIEKNAWRSFSRSINMGGVIHFATRVAM